MEKQRKEILWKIYCIISVFAMLCLFFIPSKIMALLLALMGIVALGLILFFKFNIKTLSKSARCVSAVFALCICTYGAKSFCSTWMPSRKVQAVADLLHISKSFLLIGLSVIGGIVGLYAAYYFSCLLINFVADKCIDDFPYKRKEDIFSNVKHNILFVISAAAYFCLYFSNSKTWFIGFVIAVFLWGVIASQIKSVFSYSKRSKVPVKILSAISSLGVCWYSSIRFYSKVQDKIPFLSEYGMIVKCIAVFGACVAVYFVYILTLFIFNQLLEKISFKKGIKHYEIVVYATLIIITIALSAFAFSSSEAFWGTDHAYDIIYTSDSPDLVKGNVFVNLLHPENDLRQPLFTVFSAPFMGIPYFVGKLIGAAPFLQAIFNNAVQMILLWLSIYLISKLMDLPPIKRICFITVCYSTYTFLLSSLMMEQYIVAFFWLSFALYSISERGKSGHLAFFGASGTLLTSAIILPYVSSDSPQKNWKLLIQNSLKSGISFVALMLAFCRFDVIYNLSSKINQLIGFTGESISLSNKLYQFTTFISNCFVAPDAGIGTISEAYASWQLATPNNINLFGVFVILAIVLSVIINRKKKSCIIAGAWSAFSVVMLLILGWGTKENGLILYALYFGWAYMVLLFQLIEAIEDRLKTKILIPAFSACAVGVLLLLNVPAISELIRFASTNYPVMR